MNSEHANDILRKVNDMLEESKKNNDLRVKDLKTILEGLPDDMLVVIPVVDEEYVNKLYGFRRVRTVGIIEHEEEDVCDRKVLCLNGACDGADIADQVVYSDRGVLVTTVLYAYSKYDGPVNKPVNN